MNFYAVAKGKHTGIFNSWAECKLNTDGCKGAIFKKFNTKEDAEKFIADNTKHIIISDIHMSQKVEGNKIEEKNVFDILMTPKTTTKEKIIEIENSVFNPDYYVYTDGACSNNGKDDAIAGIGIYFGENDIRNVSQRIEGKQTNNTAELYAILQLYTIIESDILFGKKIGIVSDSTYAIRCATIYGKTHEENGWKSDISNKDIVRKLFELYSNKNNIKFFHIMAHTEKTDVHSLGNRSADKLANNAIGLNTCPYTDITSRIYLIVPFIKKDVVKGLGGKWDNSNKLWYILSNSTNKDILLSKFKTAIIINE